MPRIKFIYRNHRNVTEERDVEPISLDYTPTPNPAYGYGPGWFLTGWDFSRGRDGGVTRSFALSCIQMTGFKHNTKAGVPAFRLALIDAGLTGLLEMPLPVDARSAPEHG